jgi:hypothetical protein
MMLAQRLRKAPPESLAFAQRPRLRFRGRKRMPKTTEVSETSEVCRGHGQGKITCEIAGEFVLDTDGRVDQRDRAALSLHVLYELFCADFGRHCERFARSPADYRQAQAAADVSTTVI